MDAQLGTNELIDEYCIYVTTSTMCNIMLKFPNKKGMHVWARANDAHMCIRGGTSPLCDGVR